jgi:hypothetical protein
LLVGLLIDWQKAYLNKMTRLKTQAANLYSNKQYSDKFLNLFIYARYLLYFMNQKTTFVVLGLTLAIVAALAAAPIVNELAYAGAGSGGTGGKGASSVHVGKGGGQSATQTNTNNGGNAAAG